jgi:hypothetical protein
MAKYEELSSEAKAAIQHAMTGWPQPGTPEHRETFPNKFGGGDHYSDHKAEPVAPDARSDEAFSWLGKWADVGWSVRVEPKLADEEWAQVNPNLGKCWDEVNRVYDGMKAVELLHELLPNHQLRLMWPKCGYRDVLTRRSTGRKYISICGAAAHFTVTHGRDVYDQRVAIARCELHRGQL